MILPKSRTVGLRFVLAGLLEFHVLKLILVKKEEKRTDLSESSIWTKFWWKYKLFKCLKSSSNWDCYQYGEILEIASHSRGAYALAKIRTNRPVVTTAPRELCIWELVTVVKTTKLQVWIPRIPLVRIEFPMVKSFRVPNTNKSFAGVFYFDPSSIYLSNRCKFAGFNASFPNIYVLEMRKLRLIYPE